MKNQNIILRKATKVEVQKVAQLYMDVINHLDNTFNYTGWNKSFYPTKEIAKSAFIDSSLFILAKEDEILGSVVLNHLQADAYNEVDWSYIEKNKEEVLVVHTFCISPKYLRNGYAQLFLDLIKKYAYETDIKTIRLDVSFNNTPAQKLYLKKGYVSKGKIDLKLNRPGFTWWHAMEIIL